MKNYIVLFLFLFIFSGCSQHARTITMADEHKSCDALTYEYGQLQNMREEVPDTDLSASQYFHRGVVGAGIVASLNINMLMGNYFYLYPALTIWYYNYFVDSDQDAARRKEREERRETLKYLMEKKQCNEGVH